MSGTAWRLRGESMWLSVNDAARAATLSGRGAYRAYQVQHLQAQRCGNAVEDEKGRIPAPGLDATEILGRNAGSVSNIFLAQASDDALAGDDIAKCAQLGRLIGLPWHFPMLGPDRQEGLETIVSIR